MHPRGDPRCALALSGIRGPEASDACSDESRQRRASVPAQLPGRSTMRSRASVGVERPVGPITGDPDPSDRGVQKRRTMSRRGHPHRLDARESTHGRVLTPGRAHHEMADPAGRLMAVVHRRPALQVRVVADRRQPVGGPRGVQPVREPVRITGRCGRRRCGRLGARRRRRRGGW